MRGSGFDNLKLRASWGQLGNHSVGNYDYISKYASGYNYPLGGNLQPGYVYSLSNDSLHWETTTTTDIGLDLGVLENRLTAEFDFYDKSTDGILSTAVISSSRFLERLCMIVMRLSPVSMDIIIPAHCLKNAGSSVIQLMSSSE